MHQQQRVSGPPGIEAGVDVEEVIAFIRLTARSVRIEERAVKLDVADVEEFVVG